MSFNGKSKDLRRNVSVLGLRQSPSRQTISAPQNEQRPKNVSPYKPNRENRRPEYRTEANMRPPLGLSSDLTPNLLSNENRFTNFTFPQVNNPHTNVPLVNNPHTSYHSYPSASPCRITLNVEDMETVLSPTPICCPNINAAAPIIRERAPIPRRVLTPSVTGYEMDILENFIKREVCQLAAWERRGQISITMRLILVDWLIDVAEEYQLNFQTLSLAINFLDRCLASTMSVTRDTLQLLGITCLFVAAKIEEIYPPPISEFVFITDYTYAKERLVEQEVKILNILGFKLTAITVRDFIPLYLSQLALTLNEHACFAHYLTELIFASLELSTDYYPSELAASIVMLTAFTFNSSWPMESAIGQFVAADSKKTQAKLRCCITRVHAFCRQPPKKVMAAKNKFKSPLHCAVSRISLPLALPF